MCGIAGILRFKAGPDDRGAVRAMTAKIERRGPDDQGIESEGLLTLGNRRLAILDLSDAGHQPMRSSDGRYLISFNGEIYNYKDVSRELELGPGDLHSSTDTEVVLNAWARWGPGTLDRLVGQFAFAVYDTQDRRLWLVRDRFGEKPLFYHQDASALSFASSIPALLEVPWVPRELDPESMAEYVTLRYVVSPRTVMAGINKLPGGHYLTADADGVRIDRWYAPHFKPISPKRKQDDAVEEFDALLAQASRRCLVSDVPVALLLSDGIDSNSIRAALTRQNEDVRSFTFTLTSSASGLAPADTAGGDGDGSAAMDLLVTPADRVEKMIPAFASLTEPVGDGAALATWLLIRNAREQATVFLCGHGGDEVLGGYRLSQDRFRLAVVRALARIPGALTAKVLDRFLYGAEPVDVRRRNLLNVPAARTPEAARYIIHRPLPLDDLDQLFGRRPVADNRYLGTIDRLYEKCLTEAADLDRMQEVMLHTFLSENILSFADATAMDSSAELRMPFLDRDLVDFVLSLPPSMRVSRLPGRANTKLILRWWSRDHLPEGIIKQRKRAFPFGNLPELLRLHGDTVRGRVLGSDAVRRVLPGVEGWLGNSPEYFRGTFEGTLWALLALGIWCEHHGVK